MSVGAGVLISFHACAHHAAGASRPRRSCAACRAIQAESCPLGCHRRPRDAGLGTIAMVRLEWLRGPQHYQRPQGRVGPQIIYKSLCRTAQAACLVLVNVMHSPGIPCYGLDSTGKPEHRAEEMNHPKPPLTHMRSARRPYSCDTCYTEKAPNAWQRRGTQKTRNTYNQPNRPNQQTARTKHQAPPKGQPGRRITPNNTAAVHASAQQQPTISTNTRQGHQIFSSNAARCEAQQEYRRAC